MKRCLNENVLRDAPQNCTTASTLVWHMIRSHAGVTNLTKPLKIAYSKNILEITNLIF